MTLRSRRRHLVVWSLSASQVHKYGHPRPARPVRARRLRRSVRLGALLTLIGVMKLGRGARHRWRPMLAAVVLMATGLVLRGGVWGMLIMPGLWFLFYALLIPADSGADRRLNSELERELSAYSTVAERRDFVATLDRYPDEATYELRDILANQAMRGCGGGIAAASPGRASTIEAHGRQGLTLP